MKHEIITISAKKQADGTDHTCVGHCVSRYGAIFAQYVIALVVYLRAPPVHKRLPSNSKDVAESLKIVTTKSSTYHPITKTIPIS
ncbi:hypothetical protein COCSADRAFT_339910 [Bipolaris sorokiniana ND90Pr]|uniref:Uncharacterized protein n=1 Tax=Cochliobolus sativus (strain ND90Pr / ATCC 201652) TaxID=665912 RepID=M2SLX6_COCSN|nr:uncharacterized protein COCSADRAFT_339910 [Bipolaris sorokiniana ND90Pr]EMD63300.1 hypothetical protein COCSADRAFT_339910 [Bipolaris sorokiniana ND90Pr]